MWPWEHLAFGYVLYSLFRHATGRSPTGPEVFVLAAATQFPDLVDKPLSWTFGVMPTGYGLAHSIFVAPVLVAAALLVATRLGSVMWGAAFAVGYLSHLVGDVVYPYIEGDALSLDPLLWPLVNNTGAAPEAGSIELVVYYLVRWLGDLLRLDVGLLLAFELALATFVFGLWAYDGFPGVAMVVRPLRR
ncbi:metal-dependent hydrolase [Haloprofundus salinisoli]|uniref:metal-dependent hydrolase n=1 Tax=Haloprofundus salinisoli TaxID=2876193 RepID=UPI001CCE0DFC|nr:metal-dependent hydrolase [Haloprofundus salinisoli]